MGPLWAVLGCSWGLYGRSWAALRAGSWVGLGPCVGGLGFSDHGLEAYLEALEAALGRSFRFPRGEGCDLL